MNTLLVLLLFAGTPPVRDYEAAAQLRDQAQRAYSDCLDAAEIGASESELYKIIQQRNQWLVVPVTRDIRTVCVDERAALSVAFEVVHETINCGLRANLADIEVATEHLSIFVDRVNRYTACRHATPRWQFWRRCKF
jgi:hypothetical protein